MTQAALIKPFEVSTAVILPASLINPVTRQSVTTSAPFCTAHCAKATAMAKGQQTPADGAHKAPTTVVRFFSLAKTSSLFKIRRPSTPFF